jgi:glucose/arabinose dehydrogenase
LALALFLSALGAADPAWAITAPPGVRVTTVAAGLGQPTNLAFGRRGALWTTSGGYVPAGSDGVWYTRRPGARPRHVVRGLFSALGLAWHRGQLYVSYSERRGRPTGRVDAFSGFDGRRFRRRRAVLRGIPIGLHAVDSLAPGPGGRLYLGVGSRRDASPPTRRLEASVISFRPSGRGVRVEARGFRNPYGLAFVPGTADLLVTDNGRDDLGLSRPPEEVNVVRVDRRRPAWYGFPGCFGQGGRACRNAVPPLARLAPHAAVGGIAVARRFGRLGFSAFVAENGSTVGAGTGNDVVRLALTRSGRRYRARVRRFAGGFAAHDPLGTAIGPGGALYLTLWRSGRVVRFSAPR